MLRLEPEGLVEWMIDGSTVAVIGGVVVENICCCCCTAESPDRVTTGPYLVVPCRVLTSTC